MRKALLLASLALWAASTPGLRADEHLFGYSYEADLLPQGGLEYEQWVSNLSGHLSGVYSRWQLRQELEYGFTNRFSGSLYLNFNDVYSSVNDPSAGISTQESFSFDGVSTEWKYQVLSPYKDALGLVLYFEPRYSGTELELEPKLILQKNLGDTWTLAFNAAPETEYGFAADGQTLKGEELLSAGVAYRLGQAALALELRNSRVRPQWGDETASAWYAGASVHWASEKWWATLTVLPQLTGWPSSAGSGLNLGNDDFVKLESRLVLGLAI